MNLPERGSIVGRASRAYAFGVAAAGAGVGIEALLLPLTDEVSYAPLLGAVALAVWYGGLGPGLLCAASGWAVASYALAAPRGSLSFATGNEFTRWLVSLLVALVVIGVSAALQRARVHEARRAVVAERSRSTADGLQELASSLSAAVTPTDVAQALVSALPDLLGSLGGALGVVENDELVVVDPRAAVRQTLPAGLHLPLHASAPITTAARTGVPVSVNTRAAFEREYPDGARLAPAAAGALAVPLRAGGRVVGAMGFPFARPGAIDDETIAVARIAADLGGQALERASLYEQERRTREGLDRVAQLAPRFAEESPEEVVAAFCREARETFACDVAQVWNVTGGGELEVLWREPPAEEFPPGSRVDLAEFPGLRRALEGLQPMFVPDALDSVTGGTLERVRQARVRSVLRVPVVIGGRAQRVLALLWVRVVPEPTPQAMALARRFADHAGLALEQAERRRAQEEAARNAAETERLLATTAALATTMTPLEVGEAALEEAFRAFQATQGVVVRLLGEELEIVASQGYDDASLDGWRRFRLDEEVPLAEAVRRNEIVTVESPDERDQRYPSLAGGSSGRRALLAIPLTAGQRPVGALGLSFAASRAFGELERRFAGALGRQAGQALERAALLETEHVARSRAERMAGDLAQLHALIASIGAATTTFEVARIVCDRVQGVTDADTTGVFLVEDGELCLLETSGAQAERVREYERVAVEPGRPLPDAVLTRSPVWLVDEEAWARYPQHAVWREHGVSAAGIVPLVVEERAVGALFVSFEGDRVPDEPERRLVETMARQAAQPLERVQLLEREQSSRQAAEQATERLRRVQRVSERLAAAITPADVTEVIVTEAVSALGADGALFYTVDVSGEAVELVAQEGFLAEVLAEWARLDLGAEAPVTDAIRSGEPLLLESLEVMLERYPYAEEGVRRTGERTSCTFPLVASGRTLGAVYLSYFSPVVLDEETLTDARTIFRQCAQALDRSRSYEEERVSRSRSEQLQDLTAALSGALTPEEVANVFLDEAAAALGATAAAFGVVDLEGRAARTLGWRGFDDAVVEPWLSYAVSSRLAPAAALQLGRPSYRDDVDVLASEFPELAPTLGDHRVFAFLPLRAGAAPAGVAILAWADGVRLTADQRSFVEALAAQCAQALDRARRYETERTIAETLQRSVLPETLPSMEGVEVAARYLPGTSAVDVGGDWFDTITLPDGRLGFVVGDVVGKGVRAASTMAQLRNGMRALTLDQITPAATVTKLNRLLEGYTDAPFATLAYLTLDPGTHQIALISAGHLPPLVVDPDGGVSFLEEGRGLPLGVDSEVEYEEWHGTLRAGSTVVLYTDGLVERRDRGLDEGLALLADAAAGAAGKPGEFVDELVAALLGTEERGDDVAVLAVRLDPTPLRPLELSLPADAGSLPRLRTELARWLERAAIPELDARDVLLAAWEAGANAVEHALETRDGLVRVHASLTGDRLRIEISDSGRWKEPVARDDRGLGLRLIEALMTVIDIDRSDTGTRVTMERPLTRERAGNGGAGARHG